MPIEAADPRIQQWLEDHGGNELMMEEKPSTAPDFRDLRPRWMRVRMWLRRLLFWR